MTASSDARRHALLHRVCERCIDELGVDHASIGIALGSGELVSGAASSPAIAGLDEYAFVVGEGPTLDATREHMPIFASDLGSSAARTRWPAWSAEAVRRQICAATALPIEAGAIVAGVLGLYACSPWQPDAKQLRIAHRFVGVTLLVLLDMAISGPLRTEIDAAPDAPDDELAVLLRADVHRAAGMVMAQAELPINEALSRLRAYAFAVDRPLPQIADDVLSGRLRFDKDVDSAG